MRELAEDVEEAGGERAGGGSADESVSGATTCSGFADCGWKKSWWLESRKCRRRAWWRSLLDTETESRAASARSGMDLVATDHVVLSSTTMGCWGHLWDCGETFLRQNVSLRVIEAMARSSPPHPLCFWIR